MVHLEEVAKHALLMIMETASGIRSADGQARATVRIEPTRGMIAALRADISAVA
jgi:hypothetical protein